MAGLCAPLSTLRQYPHGYLRMTRGRCGSLLLHRDGLAPSTPCRSPGALRSTPTRRHVRSPSACLLARQDLPAAEVAAVGDDIEVLRFQRRFRLLGHVRKLRSVGPDV